MTIIVLCLGWSQASAQEYRFYVQANKKKVSMAGKIQLTYKFEGGRPSEFRPPQLENFSFFGQISQGQETSIVNNKMSRSYNYQITLKPRSVGTFTIKPAVAVVNGNEFQSDEITIKVIEKTDEEKDIQAQIAENLFIKVYTSKKEAYLGEQVTVTYKLFQRVNLSGLEYKSMPSYDGFWKEVLNDRKDFQMKEEDIDGVRYQTGILESVILFPQKIGDLTIDPFVLSTKVPVQQRRGRRSFFDDFFSNYVTYDYELSSPILKIKVKPLPAGKPADFSGMVGKFDFDASLTTNQLEINDPVTLNITVTGEGNLKLLKPWSIKFPTGIEDHPAQTHDNISSKGGSISGSRRYEYLMVPYRDGVFKLPPVTFSYFDTEQGEYVSFGNSDLEFKVGKGTEIHEGGDGSPTFKNADEISVLNEDIEYIKYNNLHLAPIGYSPFGSAKHVALSVTPFALLAFLLLFHRRKEEEAQDVVGTKRKKATALAQKRLKQAHELLQKGDSTAFFDEVANAAYGYLGDKYSISNAEMSKEKALNTLLENQIGEEVVTLTGKLIDECGFARFAPGDKSTLMQTVYDKAVNVISTIESSGK